MHNMIEFLSLNIGRLSLLSQSAPRLRQLPVDLEPAAHQVVGAGCVLPVLADAEVAERPAARLDRPRADGVRLRGYRLVVVVPADLLPVRARVGGLALQRPVSLDMVPILTIVTVRYARSPKNQFETKRFLGPQS